MTDEKEMIMIVTPGVYRRMRIMSEKNPIKRIILKILHWVKK